MLEVSSYLPAITMMTSSLLAYWVMMDHNTVTHSINSEQLRQECFVSTLALVASSVLAFLSYWISDSLYAFISPILSGLIFIAFAKLQPSEFGFWDRSKIKIAILGSAFAGGSFAVFLGISPMFFPLFSSLLVFHFHHKAIKVVSKESFKTMEALRKQAIYNQAEFNNSQLEPIPNEEEDSSSNDIFHIAG